MPPISNSVWKELFFDTPIAWGNKFPKETPMLEVWEKDRDYLLWAANLKPDRPNRHPLPHFQACLVTFAWELLDTKAEDVDRRMSAFTSWRVLSREGEGIANLPRPSSEDCRNIISKTTLLGAHSDLDGIYSAAISISAGGALSAGSMPGAFHRVRLFRYGFRSLGDYSEALFGEFRRENEVCAIVIDFSAHPEAALNLDHHATALSYWEFGKEMPCGVFDPKFPSCPRLLSECCGLSIPEAVLEGCDMVDGARYSNVSATTDLSNPYVALEYALGVDVSDLVAKKAVLTLAEAALDPMALLSQPIWKARVELVRHEIEEQRGYWQRSSRFRFFDGLLAVADARLSPYSPSRFRYLPFENDMVMNTPYLLTIRPKSNRMLNLGIARNPFYANQTMFRERARNLGALAKSLGEGGGRVEASAVTIEESELESSIEKTLAFLRGDSPQ